MRLPCCKDKDIEWCKHTCKELDNIVLPKREGAADDIPEAVIKKDKRVETKAGYNKYDMNDTTYIYQSRRINNNATIRAVIDLMIEDVKKVIGFINNSRIQ